MGAGAGRVPGGLELGWLRPGLGQPHPCRQQGQGWRWPGWRSSQVPTWLVNAAELLQGRCGAGQPAADTAHLVLEAAAPLPQLLLDGALCLLSCFSALLQEGCVPSVGPSIRTHCWETPPPPARQLLRAIPCIIDVLLNSSLPLLMQRTCRLFSYMGSIYWARGTAVLNTAELFLVFNCR